MISKILKKLYIIFRPEKMRTLPKGVDLPEHIDDYTPEKVKLKEDIQKIFLKGPYFASSVNELLPKESTIAYSGLCKVYYVKRGEIIIKIKSENYLGVCILRKNNYALIPKGDYIIENISKKSNSLYCHILPRLTDQLEEKIAEERIKKDLELFNQKFPNARRIIPTIEKSGTLPGIDAVTK